MDDSSTSNVAIKDKNRNRNRKLKPWVVPSEESIITDAESQRNSGNSNSERFYSPETSSSLPNTRTTNQTRIPIPPKASKANSKSTNSAGSESGSGRRSTSVNDDEPLPSHGYIRPVKRLTPAKDKAKSSPGKPPESPMTNPVSEVQSPASMSAQLKGNSEAESPISTSAKSLSRAPRMAKRNSQGNSDKSSVSSGDNQNSENVIEVPDAADATDANGRPYSTPIVVDLIPTMLGNNLRRALDTFRERAYALLKEVDGEEETSGATYRKPTSDFHKVRDSNQYAWAYKGDRGPQNWANFYPAATGTRQSPVNIQSSKVQFSEDLVSRALYFSRSNGGLCSIENNGNNFQVEVDCDYTVSGGPLLHNYSFSQFNLHWGESNNAGSEHCIDDVCFAAELQIIFWNCDKYENATAAASSKEDPSALAIVAILIDLGGRNATLDSIIRYIPAIPRLGDRVENVSRLSFEDLYPERPEEYYSYSGSLTTPPCHENVTWIVLRHRMTMSARQLDVCRRLSKSGEGDQGQSDTCGTNRPICQIGDRIVYSSFRT